eukprot:TRINITY_DN9676_c0_g1_i2.p1 TRINITY_DN9676_c0_g1~~TRINITY_DN9676_c0_g1_i2.p1  ORF type:complete len:301 (+),score=53.92 TRINITY_DN9676_c0_g1_i2:534-1436(+)
MNDATISAFEKEIRILGSLPHHPNVCRYLFARREKDTLRLFMSLYHTTLSAVIKSKLISIERLKAEIVERTILETETPEPQERIRVDEQKLHSLLDITPAASTSFSSMSVVSKSSSLTLTPRTMMQSIYINPKQALFYALEIASGIEFLHSHGIIHRDIKCENVFVNLDMEGNIKKLAIGDFDTAKNVVVSKPKTIIGTLSYMAPEVYRSAEAYSRQADIFSYGVILYCIITLELPWGKNGLSFLNYDDVIAKPIAIPERVNEEPAFDPLVKICLRCLALNPEDRPTSKQLKSELVELAY